MKGIDVSSHNGNINWSSVKASGIEVVYIKATEGTTYQDPYLNNHYNGAKSVGLPTGFYHFLVGSSSPETQAENFYNNIKGKENNLLPCLDIEHSNNEPSNFMDYALRFIQKFKELSGMNICIYSGPYFINEYLDKRLQCYPLWVAHYGVSTPMANNVWGSSYAGHQYTETGSCGGINGNVDVNNFNEGILLGNAVVVNNTTTVNTTEYEQHGNAEVLVDVLNIRTEPSLNGSVVGKYYKGETVYNYDRVYDRDGYRWVRYIGGSGNYRYIAVRDLSDNHRLCNCY